MPGTRQHRGLYAAPMFLSHPESTPPTHTPTPPTLGRVYTGGRIHSSSRTHSKDLDFPEGRQEHSTEFDIFSFDMTDRTRGTNPWSKLSQLDSTLKGSGQSSVIIFKKWVEILGHSSFKELPPQFPLLDSRLDGDVCNSDTGQKAPPSRSEHIM